RVDIALPIRATLSPRDRGALRSFESLVLAIPSPVAGRSLRGATLRGRYAWDYLVAGVTATASACIGVLPLVARDVRWSELPSGGALRYARGASVGALLAFPLLLVFGGLFASADPVFGNVVTNALHVDFTAVASHTAFIVAGTALAAGYFWGSVVRTTPPLP